MLDGPFKAPFVDSSGFCTEEHPKMKAAIAGQNAPITHMDNAPAGEFLDGLTYVRAWQIADNNSEVILTAERQLDSFAAFKSLVREWINSDARLNRAQQRAVCRALCASYDMHGDSQVTVPKLLTKAVEISAAINSCRG